MEMESRAGRNPQRGITYSPNKTPLLPFTRPSPRRPPSDVLRLWTVGTDRACVASPDVRETQHEIALDARRLVQHEL